MRNTHTAHIESLESRQLLSTSPTPPLFVHPHAEILPSLITTVPTGYTPSQIRHAYGFDNLSFSSPDAPISADGAGQTIAIIDAFNDPYIAKDLASFSSRFHLPLMNQPGGPTFTKISRAGTPTNANWALESALDVEWAHAIAPMANIVLVQARTNSFADLLVAVNTARNLPSVSVISMSSGASEFPTENRFDSFFTTPAGHSPVSFVASSGDTGAPLSWPASSPNVLSVGGTTLSLTAKGEYYSESAWSGSTGGISAYAPKPSYQSNLIPSYNHRAGPDVAYGADPKTGFAVYDSLPIKGRSGWFRVGGTSAGSPQFAALVAIADQGRSLQSLPAFDSRTTLLPAIYSAPYTAFHDIAAGSSKGKTPYSALPGYDLATGRGSPFSDSLINYLVTA